MKMYNFTDTYHGQYYTVMAPDGNTAVKYVQKRLKELYSTYKIKFTTTQATMTAKLTHGNGMKENKITYLFQIVAYNEGQVMETEWN